MSEKKYKLIFMGTPEFSLPGFSALLNEPTYEIVGVFTQPDKPVGRKQVLTASPVKKLALKNNLKIFQPDKIKTATEIIDNLQPDIIVCWTP